jgi:hypothetical protein
LDEVLKYDIDNNSIDKLKEYGFTEGLNSICNQKYYYINGFYDENIILQIYEDGVIVIEIKYVKVLTGDMCEIPSVILDLFKDGLIIKSESNI